MLKNTKTLAKYEAISPTGCTVVDACVNGFVEQKIKYWPSAEFLFIVEVFWSDKRTTYVKRTYREFEVLRELLKQCLSSKSNAGGTKSIDYIPPLQGRRLFQKNTRELAEEREEELHNFLKQLIPGNILVTSNPIVREFFRTRQTDPKPRGEPVDDGMYSNGDGKGGDGKNGDEDIEEDILFDR